MIHLVKCDYQPCVEETTVSSIQISSGASDGCGSSDLCHIPPDSSRVADLLHENTLSMFFKLLNVLEILYILRLEYIPEYLTFTAHILSIQR